MYLCLRKLGYKNMDAAKQMYVVKRDGRHEAVHLDKVHKRLQQLADRAPQLAVDPGEIAASLASTHPDYATLAARIAVSNLHKETDSSFFATVTKLRNLRNIQGVLAPMIDDRCWAAISASPHDFDNMIQHERDYDLTYFGFKTLENSYLLRDAHKRILERPQYMYMRVAVGLWGANMGRVRLTYELLSQGYYTHATPTLFNAGTPHNQLSSCFLKAMTTDEDSIDGIYNTLRTCALISKSAGGIGFSVHDIRAKDSYIAGTNGRSNGLVPMLRVFNDTARYVDQGGNKRPGAFAAYIEPWHADVFEFLDLRKNQGAPEMRARDLHYALWIPDLFMQRVEADGDWTLMCPHECPGLASVWGMEFETLYEKYERSGKGRRVIKAQDLWRAIVTSQTETGGPFMLYKDAANCTSNHQHIGTIRSSNLCTEIIEFSGFNPHTGKHEIAVCNLASVSLPRFVEGNNFNLRKLHEVVRAIVRNLDKAIDENFYPVPEARASNMAHRPMGIGIQGLADVFCMLRLPFTSGAARVLNVQIAGTMYHAALTASCELARELGTYPMYDGSPAQCGRLHHDMWFSMYPNTLNDQVPISWEAQPFELNWDALRAVIRIHGLRNSLLIAHMPTASTSQILGNTESFEPITSNIYQRETLAGTFQVVNKHLLRELNDLGLWTPALREQMIRDHGSIQGIRGLPEWMYDVYRTVWEIPQKHLIDMSADRAPYIDQSQSFSVFISEPNYVKITSMHFYAWRKGLKTGMYYLRTKAAAAPIQFTIKPDTPPKQQQDAAACSLLNRENCTSCGS